MRGEWHIDIYEERSELHTGSEVFVFEEGAQSESAAKRYSTIKSEIESGFLEKVYEESSVDGGSSLTQRQRELICKLVEGQTSEVGRALIGLAFLQLTIKSITPEQSVRLHKSSRGGGRFSWKEGISVRSLDREYNTPFLRGKDLLKINRDGVMMTRSLAENYPYSRVYKAEIRGPVKEWVDILEELEGGGMPARDALVYLTKLLRDRAGKTEELYREALATLNGMLPIPFEKAYDVVCHFFSDPKSSDCIG